MYPDIEPYETGYIPVGDGHELYYELCGNPEGIPAVYLHGGPGAGLMPDMRHILSPTHYKIILFDQRGAGKSRYKDMLKANSIEHLIKDIEVLRQHFKVNKWLIIGGSWGSTLAIYYCISYPHHVHTAILQAICFSDKDGANWLVEEGGANLIRPEWFAPYRDFIPKHKRQNGLLSAYHDILAYGTDEEILEAAKHFILWDTSILYHEIHRDRLDKIFENPKSFVPISRIFFHFAHNFYKNENKDYLLQGVGMLGHIPCHIFHGRYDLICPVGNAFQLHEAWPNSTLHVIEDAGHTILEIETANKVKEITENLLQ